MPASHRHQRIHRILPANLAVFLASLQYRQNIGYDSSGYVPRTWHRIEDHQQLPENRAAERLWAEGDALPRLRRIRDQLRSYSPTTDSALRAFLRGEVDGQLQLLENILTTEWKRTTTS